MIIKFKIFESNYELDNIYNWWSGIKVTEDDEYYYLYLKDEYLSNKRIQLNNGLRDQLVLFYCPEIFNEVEIIVNYVMTNNNEIIIYGKNNKRNDNKHSPIYGVDISKPIKISKVYSNLKKYNL